VAGSWQRVVRCCDSHNVTRAHIQHFRSLPPLEHPNLDLGFIYKLFSWKWITEISTPFVPLIFASTLTLMFSRPGKLGKRKPHWRKDDHLSSTLTPPESPEILCNPFCLPSPALAHHGTLDGPRLSLSKHLVCELPDIYLIPPNGDLLKAAVCVWDSKVDGILSSSLDSSPSTPVATPVGSFFVVYEQYPLIYLPCSNSNCMGVTGSRSQVLIRR
jgi:hypothetical protein